MINKIKTIYYYVTFPLRFIIVVIWVFLTVSEDDFYDVIGEYS